MSFCFSLHAQMAPKQIAQKKAVSARTAKSPRKGRSQRLAAQKAVVQTDGAAIYQKPDFDSKMLGYLQQGLAVIASQKVFRGRGGFGLFYKVRTPDKVVGYVADTDLIPELTKGKKGGKENPEFKDLQEKQLNPDREPLYFSRFLGGGLGLVQLSEKFEGRALSSNEMLAHFKMVGPGTLGIGLPLDFTLALGPRVPSYYQKFARGIGSGYFIHSDLLLALPFIESDKQVLGYGLGLQINYSSFKVTVSDTPIDSQELRLGAVAGVYYMRRFGRFALRWDTKYYYERTAYFGHFLSFLIEYPQRN